MAMGNLPSCQQLKRHGFCGRRGAQLRGKCSCDRVCGIDCAACPSAAASRCRVAGHRLPLLQPAVKVAPPSPTCGGGSIVKTGPGREHAKEPDLHVLLPREMTRVRLPGRTAAPLDVDACQPACGRTELDATKKRSPATTPTILKLQGGVKQLVNERPPSAGEDAALAKMEGRT